MTIEIHSLSACVECVQVINIETMEDTRLLGIFVGESDSGNNLEFTMMALYARAL